MVASFVVEKLFSFMCFHLVIIGLNSYIVGILVRKPFFCAHEFKCVPYCFLHQIQGIRLYVEVYDGFGVEFYAGREIRI